MFEKARKSQRPFALVILDGWGVAPVWGGNAISLAQTNNYSAYLKKYPNTLLRASEEAVGLPNGAPGNSEAGHLNIGAGNIVHQDQLIIDAEIKSGSFFKNATLLGAIDHAKKNRSNLHLLGLLSKTGTHSHISHLYSLLELAKQNNFDRVFIHLLTDGRDSDPMSGIVMVNEVENKIKEIGVGRIVSVQGRFYGMDRDNRWERIRAGYNLLISAAGKQFSNSASVFADSYSRGYTDEFIEPSIIVNKSSAPVSISNNDSVIFFNFRSDRARQLTEAFLAPTIREWMSRQVRKNLYFVSFVMYSEQPLVKRAFSTGEVADPLAKILSENKLTQFHIAETEKYAHVTYFINGGREEPFSGEDRTMVPSAKSVKTYDLLPEMSGREIADRLIRAMREKKHGAYIVNFANADMVGHSGNLSATVKAVECVDRCLGLVVDEMLKQKGVVFICADHGNAEQMVNPITGGIDTEHTTNPVPFILISDEPELKSLKLRQDGSLSSVAPTILEIMNIPYNKESKAASLILRP